MSWLSFLLWGVLLAVGVGVSVWYGRSWRAVARALAEAERSMPQGVRV